MKSRFDFANALSNWRAFHIRRHRLLDEDIDELEVHLRAHMTQLREQGFSEEMAFKEAVQALGNIEEVADEYRKVHWGKLKRKRKRTDELKWKGSMLKNYFKVALRHLIKQKVHTTINVVSLLMAFCCCQLIYLFVVYELSYDEKHSPNTYRITTISRLTEGETHWINTPPALAPALETQYGGSINVTRLRFAKNEFFSFKEQPLYEKNVFYADSSFLEVFNYPLIQGNSSTALDAPNSVVLTEASAQKYFGTSDPMGETLLLRDEIPLQVTGVLEPLPSNDHLDFDMLISFPTYKVPDGYLSDLSSWGWVGFHTYIQVQEGADIEQLQREITNQYVELDIQYEAVLQPVRDIYFGSNAMVDAENSPIRAGNRFTTYWLTVICLLILTIAAFNLMSTTFGLGIKRLKEIGLRKVLGGNNKSLVSSVLLHSMIVSVVSFVLSSVTLIVVFPIIRSALNWEFSLNGVDFFAGIGIAFSISVVIGMLAGIYPALVSVRYTITKALRGHQKIGTGQLVQHIFITAQFAISVGLIFATVIIVRQIHFMRTQSLGFDQEQVLALKVPPDAMDRNYVLLRNSLLRNPTIEHVSQATRLMGESLGINTMVPSGGDAEEDGLRTAQILVDYDFVETMGIELNEGRFFSREFAVDSVSSIVINETAAEMLGYEDPIGEHVQFLSLEDREIIGVIKDFHFSSLHSEIGPLALVFTFIDPGNMLVRVSDVGTGVDAVERIWADVMPDIPLDLTFYDDRMNQLYEKEANLSYLISAFSAVAILLTIMGLYGIIVLLIENRMKEVGIRKVLGSSVSSLLVLLSKKYFLQALAALFIGLPSAYVIINFWLDNFSYKAAIPWWIFAGSAGLLILMVVSTVLYKIISAARMNPVQVIRMNG